MQPAETGSKYDKIAQWWDQRHQSSEYGVSQVKRALSYAKSVGKALDIGCGAGGRMVRLMEQNGFAVTGLDVSQQMIELATDKHPEHCFLHQDIGTWQTDQQFDFILAWDSLFHLPLAEQQPVLTKLCALLAEGGTLLYTFGNAEGEHIDQWHNDTFGYSSIGINRNLQILMDNGVKPVHLELDQYPQSHVYLIACR